MKGFAIDPRALSVLVLLVVAVFPRPAPADESARRAAARSYLKLPAGGKPAALPYVWERKAGAKHLAVLGTRHLSNPHSPMYDGIEAAFERVRPQIVLHESQIPGDLKTMSKDAAIARAADLGFIAYLTHRRGIPVRSGDASVKQEITALLARYSTEEILVFMVAQRLIGNRRNPDLKTAEAQYAAFYADYLVANGLPKREGWDRWSGFMREYQRLLGKPLSGNGWDPDLTSPIRRGRLSELARSTNAVRDRHLVASIERAMREHDRVLVVFGAWHVLAVEPILDSEFER
ncbi:hypothetical protein GLA29479_5164 [Lysobacter antibioticus]|uniref:hypothetical protein n=1 Tax=Lysobacter antibioticus TaxID=84531 RepID=UPI000720776B|nr:hypothetical protein [Lysobacter antibioticus]ALN65989.1 hypothetical protein GLA29479_5164 [Lysobacter antibioticus]